ncbi:MAG TPA: VWA domain-containing protein, partial [Vicinamibacterales bacterium]|nr:VWA domain-containing protein [Vicinamibacterales bacterium]
MRRLAVIALTTLATAGSLSAQAQAPRELEQTPQATFKSGVALVTVSVAVRTENGRVVRDLQRSDFTVIDAGQPTQIKDFYVGDSPISLAILLDISGSMAVGGNMDRAREAVAVATMNLRAESDEAALFTFDSQLQQVVGFTKDLDRIRRVSLKGTPWGKTSLYDAVADTATTVSERANRHRALLVITDGVDTGSRLSAAEVSAIANSIDVPVYLLTVVTPLDHPGTEFEVTSDGRSAQTATLEDLARWTGGDMRIASTPAHTSDAIQDLFTELRYQYLISFEPGDRTGWHPLEIRTRKKGLVVHARGGYMSGPPRSG